LAAWPQAEFFQAYGLTETAGAVCINLPANHVPQARGKGLLTSVGRAGLGAEIKIVDEQHQELPRGEVGEIVVRGPMVMQGYWKQPETTAAAFRAGGLFRGWRAGHCVAHCCRCHRACIGRAEESAGQPAGVHAAPVGPRQALVTAGRACVACEHHLM
jgi:acyl-CoA synthetase (AMP-forming)/AMP-acid ligase II